MRLMTVAVAIKRSQLAAEVEPCCQQLGSQIQVEKNDCGNWPGFLEWMEQLQPQVLLIDVEHFQNILADRMAQLKKASPKSMFIAVHSAADAQMIIAGMRAGIAEYFYPPLHKNLSAVLSRKLDEHTKDQFVTNGEGKTLGFLAAKGGCGATTLACHVAAELGKRMDQAGTYHVLLADMDVTGGTVRFLMRSKTPFSVLDAMANHQGLDVAYWNKLISNGHAGLEVISAPAAFCAGRMPEQREIDRILNFARSRYQWTILDLGCSLTQYTAGILESINELYLVASPDVLSLYCVKQILLELKGLDYSMDRVRLILNRSGEYEDKIISEEAQRMLGVPVFWKLPNDYSALSEAYASGSLLPARSALGKQISMLASQISGIEDQGNLPAQNHAWYRKLRPGRG